MSTALVPVSQIESLPAEYREHAVTAYLANARDRLADALEATGPHAVAGIKAEVATVAEMTKQLGLSKECRDDATEMVRRAEYALGKAIRKGQEDGTVAKVGDFGATGPHGRSSVSEDLLKPSDILGPNGQENHQIYAMADGAESAEDFEDALTEARAEGNLSRANVVRKVKGIKDGHVTRGQRADQVETLAREGYTSRQIASRMGMHVDSIKNIARDYAVDLHADRAVGRRQRLNSDRILSGVAESVAAAAYSLQQIDPLDLDQESAQEWVNSLTGSLNALRKALNPIKESLRG